MSRFVFLDRDGTLIYDEGYTYRTEDYRLLPGALDGLQALSDQGFRLVILTNQSGIGRGLFSEADYEVFEEHLHQDLARQGITIEASFHCPHTPDDRCSCRKPAINLFTRAKAELGADLSKSWMIGDKPSDVQGGQLAGCRGQVLIGNPKGSNAAACQGPDVLFAKNLLEAARAIDKANAKAES